MARSDLDAVAALAKQIALESKTRSLYQLNSAKRDSVVYFAGDLTKRNCIFIPLCVITYAADLVRI